MIFSIFQIELNEISRITHASGKKFEKAAIATDFEGLSPANELTVVGGVVKEPMADVIRPSSTKKKEAQRPVLKLAGYSLNRAFRFTRRSTDKNLVTAEIEFSAVIQL